MKTPGTTSPRAQAKTKAIAAYLGMWRSMTEAGRTSDWRSPKLATYATGAALSVISRGLYADHVNGVVTKGKPVTHPRVTKVDPPSRPTTVRIADCGDDSRWLKYRSKDGKLADDKPGGRHDIQAEVKKQPDGAWRVTRVAVWGVGSC